MAHHVPRGFQFAGLHCGIKQASGKDDLSLVVCESPCVAAGVYTQNIFCAPSVTWNRGITPCDNFRAVVANSGNANACTGERGTADTREMARLTAEACGAEARQVLVMSTGIIGEYLPMDTIASGVQGAARDLGSDASALLGAARGILTTDKGPKISSRSLTLGGEEVRVTGFAKGAGMIGPNMATMLAVVMTDAQLSPSDAQAALAAATDVSFNCISVEGHTSTSDTVLLLASGAAGGGPLAADDRPAFQAALNDVCIELAKEIPSDGEGASHLITIDISGCGSQADARRIARAIANSALVKTGIAGADPNWGRIVSAAGYAGAAFDPAGVDLYLNGHLVFQQGAPVEFDAPTVSASIRQQHETSIDLRFSDGGAGVRFWTSDLTVNYVRFNSDYHT